MSMDWIDHKHWIPICQDFVVSTECRMFDYLV